MIKTVRNKIIETNFNENYQVDHTFHFHFHSHVLLYLELSTLKQNLH